MVKDIEYGWKTSLRAWPKDEDPAKLEIEVTLKFDEFPRRHFGQIYEVSNPPTAAEINDVKAQMQSEVSTRAAEVADNDEATKLVTSLFESAMTGTVKVTKTKKEG